MIKALEYPKVSIIIPVYNGSKFLKEAIDSALAQTYSNLEVIVVNDGSSDCGATELIALSYGDKIRYFAKPNGGVSTALNMGIEKMTGDYFSWLSHDDMYRPEKISQQIEYLQTHCKPNTILYSGYELINEKSKVIDVVDFSRLYPINKLNTPLFPVFRGMANGCTMIMHKNHFDRVGLFNESLRTTQDYDLWFRMFRGADVKFLSGLYVKTRIHLNQTGKKTVTHTDECDNLWIVMAESVTDEEMIAMEGSPYHFYLRTAEFLKRHSSYLKAEKHFRDRAVKELEINGGVVPTGETEPFSPLTMSRGGPIRAIQRLIQNLKHEGFYATIRKVLRKLM